MTDVGRDHSKPSSGTGAPSSPPSPTVVVFVVALLAGLGAAGTAYGLGDVFGLAVGAAIAVAGAVVASVASGKSAPPDVKAIALLEAVTAENAPPNPPSRFRGEPWASLYLQAIGNAEAQRTATLAVQEVERLRRELEHQPAAAAPFVPSPVHESGELVGAGPDTESSAEAAGSDRADTSKALAEALEPIREELEAIELELDPIVASLQAGSRETASSGNSTPAKMVDALVQTAADGIEDLAAGLMRANELAGVAERVTNRATLLALNAALEATRSGSEAFASIAEETRRLAEYAREATDTISRLSGEIEVKVGETISSIQTTSEDAKAAVASLGAGTGSASNEVAPETVAALHALLTRVRTLRDRAAIQEEEPVAARAPYVPPVRPTVESREESPEIQEEEQADVQVTFVGVEERVASGAAGAPDDAGAAAAPDDDGAAGPDATPTPDSHTAFGSVAFGGTAPSASESVAPAEAEASDEPSAPPEPQASPESEAPGGPGAIVAPKIPDWLEGIEPHHRG